MRAFRLARASLAGVVSFTMIVGPVLAQEVANAPASAQSAAAATAPLAAAPAGDQDWQKELALWQAASNGNTPADFQAYLAVYPAGKFAAIAKNRLSDTTPAASNTTPAIIPVSAPVTAANPVAAPFPATVAPQAAATGDNRNWDAELAVWKAASDGNTPAEYQAYLNAYPNGKFAGIAQSRSMRLMANEPEVDSSSQAQVAAIPAQPAPAGLAAGTPETDANLLDPTTRHEVQGRLTSLGFPTGGTDGVFGPQSRQALSHWQAAAGAPVTGFLGYDQLVKLRQDSNVAYPQWLADARRHVVHRNPDRVLVGRVDNSGADAAIALGVLGIGAAILGSGIGGGHHGGFHGGGFHGMHGCHRGFC
jgi:hypothetical protein